MSKQTIGIFDSGVGGLTVLKHIHEFLPGISTVYFGDTARLPYGEKSPESILRCSLQNAHFLSQHDIQLLVVACHTAASYSTEVLRDRLTIPVLDVIDPGIKAAIAATKTGHIAILGTRATIQSNVYPKRIQKLIPKANVMSVACPLFVPLVEENFISHAATSLIVADYLKSIIGCDTVILGCTHYPHLLPVIQEFLGADTQIIDSAKACALAVTEQIQKLWTPEEDFQEGQKIFYVSDDPEKFRRQGERFLRRSIDAVGVFSAEDLAVNLEECKI